MEKSVFVYSFLSTVVFIPINGKAENAHSKYYIPDKELLELRKNYVGVDRSDGGGIIEGKGGAKRRISGATGGISGALKPDSQRAQEHAERYYESVRKMKNNHERIAVNTGFSAEEVMRVKSFIFLEKHNLGGSEPEYFYPSYEMAQSWQRLIDGKNIQKHDITLLKHELMERNLMEQGYSQSEAHRMTEQQYDYGEESRKYYAEIDKHKNKQ